ncbi:MAG: ferrous iron transport protein B [Synergistaceae bacterium]|nr:ferrous iron transport protein B [Synergistaceae bacterium]
MALRIALIGNPNSGKTTLFNLLTGENQYVGNWPGVTVEKKEGKLRDKENITITDLPGIYSLSPYSPEEIVARNFLLDENPDVILNIVDGTNLERNLYLTTQLLELGIPVVIAVNMFELVRKRGDKIDFTLLSQRLGCRVIPISAITGEGVNKVADAAILATHESRQVINMHPFCGIVEHALAHIEEAVLKEIPLNLQRWYSIKIFERDMYVLEKLNISKDALNSLETSIREAEKELDDSTEGIIANERYQFIDQIKQGAYQRSAYYDMTPSNKIDKLLTNRFLALPIFALIMFFVYYISISLVGGWTTKWINATLLGKGAYLGSHWIQGLPLVLSNLFTKWNVSAILSDLVIKGILAGCGAVLSFLPQMFTLFVCITFLEDCGYMSRIAFILDKLFRKFGLSGKSFIPFLVASGCGVPGIMATRTIENENDRRLTIITTTFIPCGAKLPMIALISATLFGGSALVALSAYLVGILAIIISGFILKKSKSFSGNVAPFVMELPDYRLPRFLNLWRTVLDRTLSYIKKAGSIILISSILLWLGTKFSGGSNGIAYTPNLALEKSLLGRLASYFLFLFKPLGFGNVRAVIATIMGLIAKEEIVAVFGVLDIANMSMLAGYSFLIFNLLCAPCVAAMAAIKKEMYSWKWTLFAISYQCVFAYCVSLIIFQLGKFYSGARANPLGVTVSAVILGILTYWLSKERNK